MLSPMPEVGEAIALVLTPVDLADGARGLQVEIRRIASDEAEEELLLYGQPLPVLRAAPLRAIGSIVSRSVERLRR